MAAVRAKPELVRTLRVQKGLEQFALAEQAGLAERTVQNVESGRQVQLASVVAVARVLGVCHSRLIEHELFDIQDVRPAVDGSADPRQPDPAPAGSRAAPDGVIVRVALNFNRDELTPELRQGLLATIGRILEQGGTLDLAGAN